MSDIVNKLWGMCHTLRHDGIDYGDYIEQLTYLLFLKMADEKDVELPKNCDWTTLKGKAGTELTDHYLALLQKLRDSKGLLGDIFAQAMPKFSNPVNLKKVITLIDTEDWSELGIDVKAAAFEGLLEKAASEGKKGAGQYFTPRVLIQSMVRLMKPDPVKVRDFTICDPACGTGGFLVASYEWLMEKTKGALPDDEVKRIKEQTYFGQDLVARPRRLALMNLFLHGLRPVIYLGDTIDEPDRGERYDLVLTNPPFGSKGAGQAPTRDDFTITTSNKQLNFLQHVLVILKKGGRAAVILPDNCLFEDKAAEVFEILMQDCDVHTILRLPRGTFVPYANAQANVVFFRKGRPTEKVWIYDNRSNIPSCTKKDRPLTAEMFADFEKCYGADPNGTSPRTDQGETGRFRSFHISEIKERGYKLDIKWLKDDTLDDPNDLPEPVDLIAEAITELEGAVDELNEIVTLLGNGNEKEIDTYYYEHKPDYAIHPGIYLEEIIESRGINKNEMAEVLEISENHIGQIINGKMPISPELSLKLEKNLNISANIWNNMNETYYLFEARKKETGELKNKGNWLKKFPISDLIKFGFIPEDPDPERNIENLLEFLGIPTTERWENYLEPQAVAYRKSPAFDDNIPHMAAWIRAGEILAARREAATYDREKFRKALTEIRNMTTAEPEDFSVRMTEQCANFGVILVFLPEFEKTHISGATKWLSHEKVLLMLSLRYKSNDHFWFSFFHEAAHILHHGIKSVFVDTDKGYDSTDEREADRFARDILIPPDKYANFIKKERIFEEDILRFANSVCIHPGIVVGRLQHDGKLKPEWHNALKEKLEFKYEKFKV